MSNQTSYNLDLTGSQIEERLNKVPEIEKESISLNAKVESLKQDIPTKTSDLTNDMDFATSQELEEVEAIAKGRASGYVFDTVEDMNIWLSNTNNVAQLKLGDNLYIRAVDVPDYWWDGSQAQELETQKVDLSEYVTQEEFDNKTIQPDWNQYDKIQPDYVKNRTHYVDRRLYYTDKYAPYYFTKYTDKWDLVMDYFTVDSLKVGSTYEFKPVNLKSVMCTIPDDYTTDGMWVDAYSDDGKILLRLLGVFGDNGNGYEIGVYGGVNCYIYYTSESLDEPLGGGFDERIEGVGGWSDDGAGNEGIFFNDIVEIYEYVPVPLDRKFLPDGIEYEENKSASIDETTKESDKNYPSVKAVVDYVDKNTKETKEYADKSASNAVVQGDLLQNDRTAKDFIKNKTHGFSKELFFIDNDDISAPYVFYKNKTNWDCWRDVPACDLKAGHTYEFKTVNMGSVLCTPTIEEYNNSSCFINAYSEDGKVVLRITGYMITNDEDAEYAGAEIGDFLGISGGISYTSESLDESFGVVEWDKQFEETGWDVSNCFCASGALEIYECTYIPLDKNFLPGDVEYTSYKTTTISKSSTNKQYPSAKAVCNYVNDSMSSLVDVDVKDGVFIVGWSVANIVSSKIENNILIVE